jgi:hypothetical protein
MRNLRYIIFLWLPTVVFHSCSEEESAVYNPDLLFTSAFEIRIPSYSYQDSLGNTYTVRGDTGYQSGITDTLNSTPDLIWDSMGIEILTAAIFNQPIQVEGGEISNTSDIIWQWHSGMLTGKEGAVQYSDGRNVIHNTSDTIDYLNAPSALNSGHYYWAVWGWNQSGVRIWYSSKQLEFYVSN